MSKEIHKDFREILEKYSDKEITFDTRVEDLDIDSLDVLEIIFKLEERWDISISLSTDKLETVGELNEILIDALEFRLTP